MVESRGLQWFLKGATALTLSFIYLPLFVICLYAFNPSNVQSWPIDGLSTRWFSPAIHDEAMQEALWLSLKAGALATAVALVLGSLAAFGVHRFRFFGRESVSFVLVLPLALPGIISGMALNSFFVFWSTTFGLWTVVVGHATFCVVIVYNNVLARLRRVPGSAGPSMRRSMRSPDRTSLPASWTSNSPLAMSHRHGPQSTSCCEPPPPSTPRR